jgi:pyrimidine operon attenuation protein/uracil phosphoribosyltransferase
MPHVEKILDEDGLRDALSRMAGDIVTRFGSTSGLVLIGIKQRGDLLARCLGELIVPRMQQAVPIGSLDITLYRDDFESLSEQPIVGQTELDFPIAGRTVILVDDVIFTGRTVRAALDELAELGRPRRVILAVLIDRGGRELPITPDIIGLALSVAADAQVQVMLRELDGRDAVIVFRPSEVGP